MWPYEILISYDLNNQAHKEPGKKRVDYLSMRLLLCRRLILRSRAGLFFIVLGEKIGILRVYRVRVSTFMT